MWDQQTVTVNRKWCMRPANHCMMVALKLCDRLMFQAGSFHKQRYVGRYICAFFSTVTMPLRKVSDLEKTVAAASGVFRDVCSQERPHHTAEKLWEG